MASKNKLTYVHRRDSAFPFQEWKPFPDEAIVLIKNIHGVKMIGPAGQFWWGYEQYLGQVAEGVIVCAARLDKPKQLSEKAYYFS